MTYKLLAILERTRRADFLLVCFSSFIFKYVLSWQQGMHFGWQDELAWSAYAKSHSFTGTISQLDAGYPTPLLRSLSFLLGNLFPGDFYIWHLAVIFFISLAVASLTLSKVLNRASRYVVAGVLISYPSFDLLLLHNLAYWMFIPLFVALTNIYMEHGKISFSRELIIVTLLFASTKPQLLISALILLVCIFRRKQSSNLQLFFLSIPTISLLVAGRLSHTKLEVSLDWASLGNFFLTFFAHFTFALFPIFTLVIYGASKYLGYGWIITFYILCSVLISWIEFFRTKLNKISDINRIILISSLPTIASVYFFGNSGWSQDDLLTSNIYTSLFSRHYLPILLFVTFLIFNEVSRFRIRLYLALGAVLQNSLLQVLLFQKFYKPI